MKRMIVVVTALLMVVGFSVVEAQAAGPFCLDFTSFCDGLEISSGPGNQLSGFWQNTDCAGTPAPISGMVFSGPLGYGAYVTGDVGGFTFGFFIDLPVDGTMDMYIFDGGWTPWITGLAYDFSSGPCVFTDDIGTPGISTTSK